MIPEIVSTHGTSWKCICGYCEEAIGTVASNKTTYDGGCASMTDKTIYIKHR